MRVLTRQDRLVAFEWPEARQSRGARLGPSDTLMLCAGFEDRATALLDDAIRLDSKSFSVVCIDYLPSVTENRKDEVSRLAAMAGADLKTVVYDRELPEGAAQHIFEAVPPNTIIHLDVSGMSRLLIVQLVTHALQSGLAGRVQLWYAEAVAYPPTQEEVQARSSVDPDPVGIAMFLSSGVFGVTALPELSTVAMHGQPIRLVAFPSWNSMQIAALCAEVQASSCTMIHGLPPLPENAWRPTAIRALNGIDALPSVEERTTSTLDYRETLHALVDIYSGHAQREKILLAPTGSKMQAVAVGIMRAWFHDIQVLYPTPRTFSSASDYTRGVRAIYALPLGAFAPPSIPEATGDLVEGGLPGS